jgi:hypothetical protein
VATVEPPPATSGQRVERPAGVRSPRPAERASREAARTPTTAAIARDGIRSEQMIHREMQVPRPTLAVPEWEMSVEDRPPRRCMVAQTLALRIPLAEIVNGTHLAPEAVARVARIKAALCRTAVDSAELPMDRTVA